VITCYLVIAVVGSGDRSLLRNDGIMLSRGKLKTLKDKLTPEALWSP
jgi:hypothetical protein